MESRHVASLILMIASIVEEMGIDPSINGEIINIGLDEEVISINKLATLCANETGLNKLSNIF